MGIRGRRGAECGVLRAHLERGAEPSTWSWGLRSSSRDTLISGPIGAALVVGGAVRWGGLDGILPVGVLGGRAGLGHDHPGARQALTARGK